MRESVLTAARARVTWGESRDAIRAFLASEGLKPDEVDSAIKELFIERNSDVRRRGVKNAIIGVLVLAIAGVVAVSILCPIGPVRMVFNSRIFGAAILAAGFGFWKLFNGVMDFFAPASNTSSISDVR
jgi:hypothetical protein